MTLRRRIALVTAAVLLPTVLAIFAWDAHDRRRAAEQELITFTRGLLAMPGWIEGCEADPARWTGRRPTGPPDSARRPRPPGSPAPSAARLRRPGPAAGRPGFVPVPHSEPARFFAYGADGQPLRPDNPALPAGLPDDAVALDMPARSGIVRISLPTASPICARIVGQGTTEPWLGGVLPATHVWLVPVLAVVGAVLLAVGPVVRRIRRLTRAVQRSADADYAESVADGGRDEIGALARAFDAAARQVREQLEETRSREAALRDYVANTTHDVMIPLTVLRGHLAELEAGGAACPDAMRGALREAHYLGALIHNLGVSARLATDDGPMHANPVDLTALVERVVARHRPVARGEGVDLQVAVPPGPLTIDGDVTLLEQAVGNLVDNAIRYGRAHAAVVLDPLPAGFVLAVIDDGPGIEPDAVEAMLARGGRADAARSRAPKGQGLGLYIAARVAERHGLALNFGPVEGGGLRVELGPSGGLAG